jgi:hypothetical protein
LFRFPVTANYFDGQAAAGPVPIFFSCNPEEAYKQLKDYPHLAHGYLQALCSRILLPEDLTAIESMGYVQGPREGKANSPFLREWNPPRSKPAKQLPDQHQPGPSTDPAGGFKNLFNSLSLYNCYIPQYL